MTFNFRFSFTKIHLPMNLFSEQKKYLQTKLTHFAGETFPFLFLVYLDIFY